MRIRNCLLCYPFLRDLWRLRVCAWVCMTFPQTSTMQICTKNESWILHIYLLIRFAFICSWQVLQPTQLNANQIIFIFPSNVTTTKCIEPNNERNDWNIRYLCEKCVVWSVIICSRPQCQRMSVAKYKWWMQHFQFKIGIFAHWQWFFEALFIFMLNKCDITCVDHHNR